MSDGKQHPGQPGHPNQVDVTVIVGGEDVRLRVNENAPLHVLVEQALHDSGNEGQPLDRWQVFLGGAQLTDLAAKIGALGIAAGTTLSMSLAAGAGG